MKYPVDQRIFSCFVIERVLLPEKAEFDKSFQTIDLILNWCANPKKYSAILNNHYHDVFQIPAKVKNDYSALFLSYLKNLIVSILVVVDPPMGAEHYQNKVLLSGKEVNEDFERFIKSGLNFDEPMTYELLKEAYKNGLKHNELIDNLRAGPI